MKNDLRAWGWIEGKVAADEEHIEIRYGNAEDSDWEHWQKIALVGPPKEEEFTVQFLMAVNGTREQDMINKVKRELDFYLVDKQEKNPWAYAHYHCGTAANLYSNVHWSYFPKGRKGSHSKEGLPMKTESSSWLWPHFKSILGQHEQTLSSWCKQVPTQQGRIKNFENWLLVELVHKLAESTDVKEVRTNGHFTEKKISVRDVERRLGEKLKGSKAKANNLSADISIKYHEINPATGKNIVKSAEIKTGLSPIEIMDDLLIVKYYNVALISDQAEFGWVVLLPKDEKGRESSQKTYEKITKAIETKCTYFTLLKSDKKDSGWLLFCVTVPNVDAYEYKNSA